MVADFQKNKINRKEESLVQYFKRNIEEIDSLNVDEELKKEIKTIFITDIKEGIVIEKAKQISLESKNKLYKSFVEWIEFLVQNDLSMNTYGKCYKALNAFENVLHFTTLNKEMFNISTQTLITNIEAEFLNLVKENKQTIISFKKSYTSSYTHDHFKFSRTLRHIIIKSKPVFVELLNKDIGLNLFFNEIEFKKDGE